MTVYASVIAVTKDLGDVEGDRIGGINTFARRFGARNVARAASAVLGLNYATAIVTALLASPGTFRCWVMVPGHALAAALLTRSSVQLDTNSSRSLQLYYQQIWNLFYFEYALYPFI